MIRERSFTLTIPFPEPRSQTPSNHKTFHPHQHLQTTHIRRNQPYKHAQADGSPRFSHGVAHPGSIPWDARPCKRSTSRRRPRIPHLFAAHGGLCSYRDAGAQARRRVSRRVSERKSPCRPAIRGRFSLMLPVATARRCCALVCVCVYTPFGTTVSRRRVLNYNCCFVY